MRAVIDIARLSVNKLLYCHYVVIDYKFGYDGLKSVLYLLKFYLKKKKHRKIRHFKHV